MLEGADQISATAPIKMGDYLIKVAAPLPITEDDFAVTDDPKHRAANSLALASDAQVRDADPLDLRALAELEVTDALVVRVCTETIFFAPVRPWDFSAEKPKEDQWDAISHAATGVEAHKSFYIAARPDLKIRRSLARIDELFILRHGTLAREIADARTQRIARLTSEAREHLSWQIGVHFSRHARDDYQWPSKEDLELKLAWREKLIAEDPDNVAEHQADRAKILDLLGKKAN